MVPRGRAQGALLAPPLPGVYRGPVFARRALLVTIFLMFVADTGAPYADWFAPFGWAHFLSEALPWKIRAVDHVFALCLLLAPREQSRGQVVRPMRNMLLLAAGTTAVCFAYGVMRGGDSWAGAWQTYLMMSGVLFAFAVSATFRTQEHYVSFAKVLVAAAAYRAVMCWCYYLLYIRTGRVDPLPEYLTSHDDTVLWVVCILLLLLRLIEPSRPGDRFGSFLLVVLLGGAVLFNQRRLAWVSLGMGGALLFFLLPPGKAKRRAARAVLTLSPILLIYTAVGWGRPERIFKPLQSISTVSTAEDTSTKARNVENLGLIATSNANNPLFGTGWGHPYIEVSNKYSIAKYFPLWRFIPHNSILGLLAYSGILGFCGYWLVFPTAMFLTARMARMSKTPGARHLGAMGAAQLVVCANQFYGDMGIYYAKSVYMLALSYAIALRLPVMTGVWPGPKRVRRVPEGPALKTATTSSP